MSERDTQFAGFANLLLTELRPDLAFLFTELGCKRDINRAEDIIKQHITRRAYDLVYHTLANAGCDGSLEHTIGDIPDLTTWPEEAK